MADAKLKSDLNFETRLAIMTDSEAEAAQRLRVIWGDQIPKAELEATAALIEHNRNLKDTKSAIEDIGHGLLSDIQSGKSLGDIIMSRVSKLEDKMFDKAWDSVVGSVFKSSGGFDIFQPFGKGGLFNLFGANNTSGTSPSAELQKKAAEAAAAIPGLSTTGVMNVSAGVVNVTSGISAAPGGAVPFLDGSKLFGASSPTATAAAAAGSTTSSGWWSAPGGGTQWPTTSVPGWPNRAPTLPWPGATAAGAYGTPSPQVLAAAQSLSQQTGLPISTALSFASIESGMNPGAHSAGSSYYGLFQTKNGSLDPMVNAGQAAGTINTDISYFQARMGRMPTGAEAYFMHQQGDAGAFAHWNNPDAPAWQNFQNASGWSDSMSQKAIWGNVPTDMKGQFGGVGNVTSGDFWNMWQNKFNAREQSFQGFNGGDAAKSMTDLSKSASDSATAMSTAAAGATDMTSGLNSATSGLGDLSKGLSSMFSGSGSGGFPGFGGLSGLFGGGGSGFGDGMTGVGSMRSGGVVALGSGPRILLPTRSFDGAPHFGGGGVVGGDPTAVPLVAHMGEEILTESNPRHRNNFFGRGRGGSSGMAPISIVVQTPDLVSFNQSRAQVMRGLGEAQKRLSRYS
jgi:hypothetical protein